MNAAIPLPKECAAADPHDAASTLPGITRNVMLKSEAALVVTSLGVDSGIRVIEAESLKNSYKDSGYEAFYSFGTLEPPPSNGLLMVTDVKADEPVDLDGNVDASFRPGAYDVWILHRTFHPRFYNTRAEVSVLIDGHRIGATRGESRVPREFWERDVLFEWIPLGPAKVAEHAAVTLHIEKIEDAVAGLADVDALAFVPRD
jgi:hypothetical protein